MVDWSLVAGGNSPVLIDSIGALCVYLVGGICRGRIRLRLRPLNHYRHIVLTAKTFDFQEADEEGVEQMAVTGGAFYGKGHLLGGRGQLRFLDDNVLGIGVVSR